MATINCANCGASVNAEVAGCPECGADPRTGEIPEQVRRLASPVPKPTAPKPLRRWPAVTGLVLAVLCLLAAMQEVWTQWAGPPDVSTPGSFTGFATVLVPFVLVLGLRAGIRGVRARRRASAPHATANMALGLASLAVLVGALSAPLWMLSGPADWRNYYAAKGAHHINLALQAWAEDHGDRYPQASRLDAEDLAGYLGTYLTIVSQHDRRWPQNQFDKQPMHLGTGPGDYGYWVSDDGYQYQLVAYGRAQVIYAVGFFDGEIVLDTM